MLQDYFADFKEDIMLKPRIQFFGFRYKTGTNRIWTDKYTWEDYEMLRRIACCSIAPPLPVTLWNIHAAKEIKKYFQKYPEELLDTEPFKGYNLDQIKSVVRYLPFV